MKLRVYVRQFYCLILGRPILYIRQVLKKELTSTSISYKCCFFGKLKLSERLAKHKFTLPFPRARLAPEWLLQCWCLEMLCFLFSPLGCSQPLNPPLPLRTCNYYFFHDALLSACPVDQKELHSLVLGGCKAIKASVFATKHFTFGHDLQG